MDALERIAVGLERLAGGRVLPPVVPPGRDLDLLGRQVPRNPFRGKAGLVLALRMGMAAQFEKRVPERFVTYVLASGVAVACACGEVVPIDVGEVVECPGGCERWFLATESSVRVARWPRAEEESGG